MVDFSLNSGVAVINSDVDLILQQINLLFDTTPRDVLGYEQYGSQYDKYLYNLKISNESLKQQVLSDINSLELFGFSASVEVYLLQGTEQDIALIEINLSRYDESYSQIYKITK